MKFEDYGIDKNRKQELMELVCLKENREILEKAAQMSNSYLAPYLVASLTSDRCQNGNLKAGCRTLFQSLPYSPCTENDFYAYRKKTLAIFDSFLKMRDKQHKGRIGSIKGDF